MGSSKSPKQPAPIDPGKSMGEYLFGKDFSKSYQGITDPVLQDRLIEAEGTYRPQYTALELRDINTMAYGIQGGTDSFQYKKLEAELAGLKAGQELTATGSSERRAELEKQALLLFPDGQGQPSKSQGGRNMNLLENMSGEGSKGIDPAVAQRSAFVNASLGTSAQDRATRIGRIEAEMSQLETAPDTKGLFDMLEDQSERAGILQRSELVKQRQADVDALREFAPQVVQANRDADPYSTALAEKATANAVMKAASSAERALQSSGLSNINAQREAASAAEQELNKVGMSLSDLSPTEQEAILSGRGMEFAASTGELTALEKRRAQQSSREASVARGRGMDQSAVYGEMQARMAAELNKQEREIALGAGLLGQQADMRLNRLGKGAGILGQAEAMDAQRRPDQLQRQQFGAQSLAQAESASAQRRADYRQNLALAFEMNRSLAGDAGNVILGRPSASIGLGNQMLGQATAGAAGQMGPQLFDPNVGLNMALQQRGQDVTFQGMQAQADAASSAGMMGAVGGIAQGIGSAGGLAAFCWVAREVYGIENPKWLEFREWMLNDSPSWFRNTYIKYGERFAKFISNKPRVKSIIRKWMNTKIK